MNVLGNSLFIFIMFAVIFSFIIALGVLNPINTGVQDILDNAGISKTSYMQMYDTYKGFILNGLQFLLYALLAMLLYSSFVNVNSVQGYVSMAIAGTMITVLLGHITMLMWNNFVAGDFVTVLDFSENDLWFISNIQNILLINLLAGLASFIFVRGKDDVKVQQYY